MRSRRRPAHALHELQAVHTHVPTSEAASEPVLEPPDMLAPGAHAGPWIVERELGRGGMGAVYGVVHEEIGKRAALKVMHRRLIGPAAAERILLEARVVNQVGHPNIVDIFETGELPDGRPYIVMERLDGVTLGQHAATTRIRPDIAIRILLEVCDALIAAHAAGIIHRDLKLDNVFLIDDPEDPSVPRVKLLDWGIAKVMTLHDCGPGPGSAGARSHAQRCGATIASPGSAGARSHAQRCGATIDGQLVGTPQYLAPEQARGAAVSHKTDVYSLGVMAYELFVEQLPFEAETSAEVMAMHLRATPPKPSELWPDIPGELEALLLAMLAKSPDARPSMLAVARTLEAVRDELARHAAPPPEPPRCQRWSAVPVTEPVPRRPRRWKLALGAAALATGAGLFAAAREPTRTPGIGLHTSGFRKPPEPVPLPKIELVSTPRIEDPKPDVPRATPDAAPPKKHHARLQPPQPPTKPRRELPIDPDGVIDPYR
ncbi:MAG TPA: serine/threonine-protein kinase [Kofleriaceae bacterium]|nr:serine/threonine-protein kinase [Kofleriaceae bacterium]